MQLEIIYGTVYAWVQYDVPKSTLNEHIKHHINTPNLIGITFTDLYRQTVSLASLDGKRSIVRSPSMIEYEKKVESRVELLPLMACKKLVAEIYSLL